VGEEWLYQAYGHSYLPLLQALSDLADRGFRNMASLGITPILAAQLDHPYALTNLEIWLHDWQLRTQLIPRLHPARKYHMESAATALHIFRESFSRGASPVIRKLIDSEAIEILGGPLSHPLSPLLDSRVHSFALSEGLQDARRRWGHTPVGIWVPECAYRPGQEHIYEDLGVHHFLLDETAVISAHGVPNQPYLLAQSSVTVVGRDSQASDLVWSAERGYPGRPDYLDFHDVDNQHGLRLSRVGDRSNESKEPYNPTAARDAAINDAQEFITRLTEIMKTSTPIRTDKSPLVVIAIDTELLGHWWREGITWFTRVIELLPHFGLETVTLEHAAQQAQDSIFPGETSWGEGKDLRLWTSDRVRDLVVMNHQTQEVILDVTAREGMSREHESAVLNEAMLQLSSDWAFMISRDSAADYGRNRAQQHYLRIQELLNDPQEPLAGSLLPFHLTWPGN
jgi:1,4-alpha-glucan branching enzyme